MPESIKRLRPRESDHRDLLMLSGNQCAFEHCARPLITSAGVFAGQLCHIESVGSRGERFNDSADEDDARLAANLLFLCYEHHQVTNNVDEYPVERMRLMKRTHEELMQTGWERMEALAGDITLLQAHVPTITLNGFIPGTPFEPQDVESVNNFGRLLARRTLESRFLLTMLVSEGKQENDTSRFLFFEEDQARRRLGTNWDVANSLLTELATAGLVQREDPYDDSSWFLHGTRCFFVDMSSYADYSFGDFLGDLHKHQPKEIAQRVLEDLDFSILD